MEQQQLGRRERKKLQTRRAISDHATRLFIAHGFENTTIADIAEAADVAKKTVTNYFQRKEDLALDHADTFVDALAQTVLQRKVGESALTALRAAFLTESRAHNRIAGFSGFEFATMVNESPTLVSRIRELHELREQALAAALATTTAAKPTDITPRVAAAQLAGVHKVLFTDIQHLTLAGKSDSAISRIVIRSGTAAFELLEPALANYAIRQT